MDKYKALRLNDTIFLLRNCKPYGILSNETTNVEIREKLEVIALKIINYIVKVYMCTYTQVTQNIFEIF